MGTSTAKLLACMLLSKKEYGCSSTVVDTGVRLPKTSKRTPHRSGPTFLILEMPKCYLHEIKHAKRNVFL